METKKWYTSKVIWANVIATVLGIIALVDANFGTNLTHQEWYGFLLSIAGMFGIGGRVTTNSMIEKKIL